jgi:hypothetical protein
MAEINTIRRKSYFSLPYKLHIFSGMFSSVYFLIVGVSALNVQHHFLREGLVDTVTSARPVVFDAAAAPDSAARGIQRSLHIAGHVPPWLAARPGNT